MSAFAIIQPQLSVTIVEKKWEFFYLGVPLRQWSWCILHTCCDYVHVYACNIRTLYIYMYMYGVYSVHTYMYQYLYYVLT
jgi:hypothetical protein